ncbi:MAG TPA: beta-propeller domain-containing protein [Polyangiaceae bacterium]|nr:beta-propeller domain-containing protein [Polyangiaceae bacterium]
MTLRKSGFLISLGCLLVSVVGCESNSGNPTKPTDNGEPGVFESDAPNGSASRNKSASLDSSTAGEAAPTANAGDDGSAARAIEEADIIKLEGTRLYALSQYGGLSVIDVSNRDQMRLLGRKKVQAQPFEMYVRDQVVFALYNGYGEYVPGTKEGEWSWVTTSYVMAFDTHDPSNPAVVGKFEVPGTIQDSRIVGNALYVVGYQTNGCWGCADGESTTIISLDVSAPNAIRKVDERMYADDTTTQWSWKRSVTVTDKRMYIAGPEYGTDGPLGSTIQVVDISDPTGKLVDGAKVSAAGKIDSRWQMDETAGVLRVISQPGVWRPTDPPRIQTFGVESAQAITKLATVDMVVPQNESLRSVRFDGPRGYAITAVQTDPLFTIDLTDPAIPRQAGELVMPGWVYYMEPRGERVVGLGYDQGNAAGALAVSLFDVSNLAKPTMLARVNFGGDWAWIGEDQDRVHKAFQVLDAANLVLMPFSGYSYRQADCSSTYNSGVQLIDWTGDTLSLKGVAPTIGAARRGFLYNERLFTVSDERVESFSIADRAKPVRTDQLKLAENVSQTLDAGTAVVKVGQDWWSGSVSIDTTTLAAVQDPASNGHLDVQIDQRNCNSWSSLGSALAKDGKVFLLIDQYNYEDKETGGTSTRVTRLITVDVANPAAPTVVGEATIDFGSGWNYWYNAGLVNAGSSAVMAGNVIVAMGRENVVIEKRVTGDIYGTKSVIKVIDPANPSAPQVSSVELPISLGTTGLLASGNIIGVGHFLESPSNPERVRFYVDRLDITDPKNPVLSAPVNVPGSPVAFDAKSSNVVTVDYTDIKQEGIASETCYSDYKSAWFEYPDGRYEEGALGTCHSMQETVSLVALSGNSASVLGAQKLEVGQAVSNVAVGDDRVFMAIGAGGYRPYGMAADVAVSCKGCGGYYGYSTIEASKLPLIVVAGLGSSAFALGQVELSGGDYWSYSPIVASGQRALLSTGWRGKLAVVDGANVAAPTVVREAEVVGSAQHLTAIAGIGIASMYYDGVQTIQIKD